MCVCALQIKLPSYCGGHCYLPNADTDCFTFLSHPFGILALSVFNNTCNSVFYQLLKISSPKAVSCCILNHLAFEIDFVRRNNNNS